MRSSVGQARCLFIPHKSQLFLKARSKEIDSPSPREFGRVYFATFETSTEFTRRGGRGVRSNSQRLLAVSYTHLTLPTIYSV